MTRHCVAAYYLAAQGVLGLAWWVGVATVPAFRAWFLPAHWPEDAILAFGLAEFTIFAMGSLVAARLVGRRSPLRTPALWMTAGGVAYGALWCIGTALRTGDGWISAGLMVPAAILTMAIAWRYA